MLVKEVMKIKVVTLDPEMTCREAAEVLLQHKISGAPVVDTRGKLLGVISEKDLFRAIYPNYREFHEGEGAYLDFEKLEQEAKGAGDKKISEVMSSRLIVAAPDTPILQIGAQMIASGIHRVPVVDNGKLVGMVSRRDIYGRILNNYFGLWEGLEKYEKRTHESR
ncbi:MAG: CBS domain containing protein [Parcubacteria group bacterium GW2011_GWA2_47_26]|nr:MAG: CBS domain containing protein [Parcubacteria group bacterium GW2011_GWA2_47_26]